MFHRFGRLIALIAVASITSAVHAQSGERPMGYDDARHLLARTSFGASERDVQAFARLSRAQGVERLLATTAAEPRTPPPGWVEDWTSPTALRAMSQEERMAFLRTQRARGNELKAWWLAEMLTTPTPFTERMTLFWHNHFVSSLQKVRQPRQMYRQNLLLRRHALGNFGEMLHAVAKDPAMIVYLDGASNRRGQPNENFAREVMELFTLGEGGYGERDVKEAARAFTGWSLDPATGDFLFRRGAHDDGEKTILGRTGAFDGEGVLDLLLAEPRTAELIVAKLWRELVSPEPDPLEVKRIAGDFRASRHDIRTAVRGLLGAPAFWAPENRGVLVKSPVDLLVGTLRQFRFEIGDPLPFALTLRQLGQDLMMPPNVKGWPGGTAWIDATTLLARKQTMERLFRSDEARAAAASAAMMAAPVAGAPAGMRDRMLRAMASIRFDPEGWMADLPARDAPSLIRLLLPIEPVQARIGAADADAIRALVLDPAYQLK